MSEAKKWKLWRFHFSTAVAMVIVAGGLIGANVRPNSEGTLCAMNGMKLLSTDYSRVGEFRRQREFGWPLVCVGIEDYVRSSNKVWVVAEGDKPQFYFARRPLLLNILISVVIILSFGVVLEFLIRRREDRKT
jgi:hypothetical protein